MRMLEEEARRLRHSRLKLRLMPAGLYAGLPAVDQLAALSPAPRGYRKASAVADPAHGKKTPLRRFLKSTI